MKLIELISEQSKMIISANNSNNTEEILKLTAIKLNDNDITLLVKRDSETIASLFVDSSCKFVDTIKCLVRKLAIIKFYTHQIDIITNGYNLSILINWDNTIILKDSLEDEYKNKKFELGSKATIIAIKNGVHNNEIIDRFDIELDNEHNAIKLSIHNNTVQTVVLESFNPFSICECISEYILSKHYIPKYFYIEINGKLKSFLVLRDKTNSLVILHT